MKPSFSVVSNAEAKPAVKTIKTTIALPKNIFLIVSLLKLKKLYWFGPLLPWHRKSLRRAIFHLLSFFVLRRSLTTQLFVKINWPITEFWRPSIGTKYIPFTRIQKGLKSQTDCVNSLPLQNPAKRQIFPNSSYWVRPPACCRGFRNYFCRSPLCVICCYWRKPCQLSLQKFSFIHPFFRSSRQPGGSKMYTIHRSWSRWIGLEYFKK